MSEPMYEFGRRPQSEQESNESAIPEEMQKMIQFRKEIAQKKQEEIAIQTRNKQELPVEEIKDSNSVNQPIIPIANLSAKEIIERLKSKRKYEEVRLPSRNILYTSFGLELDKPIHIRPMTIEEEKVLSTPRLVRSGQAIDKVIESCMHERIPAGKLLSIDRIFLLFYIRGISYGPQYEVEIKCPSCDTAFTETITLDGLPINYASDNFTGELSTLLPDSQLIIWYRLSNGDDERILSKHRDMKIKEYGGQAVDDSLVQRSVALITRIGDIANRIEIEQIVNYLSAKDSNYLREIINNPDFGVDTNMGMTCPYCYHEWQLSVPIDVNFFFPRTKKAS